MSKTLRRAANARVAKRKGSEVDEKHSSSQDATAKAIVSFPGQAETDDIGEETGESNSKGNQGQAA
jgi:hypothetical protein